MQTETINIDIPSDIFVSLNETNQEVSNLILIKNEN